MKSAVRGEKEAAKGNSGIVHVDGEARVKGWRSRIELFGVHRGVRQGCTLSPWLLMCLWTG